MIPDVKKLSKHIDNLEEVIDDLQVEMQLVSREIKLLKNCINTDAGIKYLHSLGYNWTAIANLMGLSPQTVRNRAKKLGIRIKEDK